MSHPVLILASQSEARCRLLRRLGFEFTVQPAAVDENALGRRFRQPRQRAKELARAKARTVFMSNRHAIVIGSDQLLVCGGHIFGKPGTAERARKQLAQFSGRTIRLLTAVSVLSVNAETVFVHETKMKFRNLSRKEIADYVEIDRPLECAGSFKFESCGIRLFDSVSTDDPTAIEGLPLLHLGPILRKLLLRPTS